MFSINKISLVRFDEKIEKNFIKNIKKKSMNLSMKEMYYVECKKYRKIVNPNISNIFIKYQFFLILAVNVIIITIEYLKKKVLSY